MDYSLRVTILQIFDLLKVLASSCTYKYTHTHTQFDRNIVLLLHALQEKWTIVAGQKCC